MDTEMEVNRLRQMCWKAMMTEESVLPEKQQDNVKLWLRNFTSNLNTPDLERKESANTSEAKNTSQGR